MQADGFPDGCVNPYTEDLVVQTVLGEMPGYPLTRIHADLDDLQPGWVEESIESLQKAGVVVFTRTRLHMSPALRRLDALDLICI